MCVCVQGTFHYKEIDELSNEQIFSLDNTRRHSR